MRSRITITLLLAFLSVQAQFNPQPKEITEKFFPEMEMDIPTPAFQKEKGFTKYTEMMSFLNSLVSQYPDLISYRFIGESQKGKQIPMVSITKGEKGDKLKFWMQGGLHGNEPASTEGILYFIYQLLNAPDHEKYLSAFEFGIIPMANIDGYEKQDRYAANGLDLNRDQTKFTAPESVFLKQAFSDFQADIAMDFHEYRPFRRDYMQLGEWGVNSPYDVMFLYSGNLNVPMALRKYTKENFVSAAANKMEAEGFTHHDYFSASKYYGETQLNEGSVNTRSSATSYALSNCISTLVEVRGVALGRTSFKRRTYITYSVGMAYLTYAFNNDKEVRKVLQQAAQDADRDIVVTSEKIKRGDSIPMIDNYAHEMTSVDLVVNDSWLSIPEMTRKRPQAYLILPGNEELTKRLGLLGIEVKDLDAARQVSVEAYTVTDYFRDVREYEGVHRQKIKTSVDVKEVNIPKGTSIVYLNQARANLAVEVLEPEALNSFVSFSVLPTGLGEELPVYRYMSDEDL